LATADGKYVIPEDCDTCHTFLVEDSPTLLDLETLIEWSNRRPERRRLPVLLRSSQLET
jgi:hypothetical protein